VSTERQKEYTVTLPKNEIVGWIWCLFFAFIIPEIMTFLRASRICFFKNVNKPTMKQFLVVATAETLRTIGTGLLVFMILPTLDVVKGAMLTNCLCFVPGLIGKATFYF
jgi:chitin synthase